MSDEKEPKEAPDLPKDEAKFLMNAIWESLVAPPWTKDDLIDFGKAIFAKGSIKKSDDRAMPDKVFAKVFPFLRRITNELGARLQAEANKRLEESQASETSEPATIIEDPKTKTVVEEKKTEEKKVEEKKTEEKKVAEQK